MDHVFADPFVVRFAVQAHDPSKPWRVFLDVHLRPLFCNV